ncbi:MAG: tRNA-dihydrouridine synthase family protein [Phycisphaerae bacterium]|nr:tRNA-dihydrouridine synthase family protein [Phycisphaerae bacterium]
MSPECNTGGCDDPNVVSSGNATPPAPAYAPGAETIDPRRAAEEHMARFPAGVDPRVADRVPGFDAPFFQAGLAGYSDAAMRIIARRHGCPFCVTESLLDRTLLAGGRGFAKADLGELHDNVPGGDEDRPLAGQIMGSDPREMAAAALKMAEQGARSEKPYRALAYAVPGQHPSTHASARRHLRLPGGEQLPPFDPAASLHAPNPSARHLATAPPRHLSSFAAIDVNLACPVKKIDRKARGGHWLREPEGAIAILEAVRQAVPAHIPCTVKLRRAYDDTPEMAESFERLFDAAYRMGYAWATVHARTVEQKYVGPSRWTFLRDLVRRHPERPVFGSGDAWTAGEVFRMIAYTGVAGVSVARGCIGNPWIFRQARDLMAGRQPAPPTIEQQRDVLLEHFRLALAVNSPMRRAEVATARMMRKFGIRFAAHHPRGDEVRRRMIAVSTREDWERAVDDLYGPIPRPPRASVGGPTPGPRPGLVRAPLTASPCSSSPPGGTPVPGSADS